MKRGLLPVAAVIFGTFLTGCAGHGAVVVGVTPPPPRYAVIGRPPGPGFVWADGYWDRHRGGWFWVDGRWMRPPHLRAVWVPGRWEQRGRGGWVFRRGHWR